MELQIKTFRIHNEADELALNAFLQNKLVRHWSTTFVPDTTGALGAISSALTGTQSDAMTTGGSWNVFIAYEVRMNEPRTGGQRQSNGAMSGNQRGNQREGAGNQRDGGMQQSLRNATGTAAKPKSKDLTPREDYIPDVAAEDMPLFEALRKWRNARARDERVKPFNFFNNRQLESVVKAKPTTQSDLRGLLPDMEAPLFERYHNELLGFLGASMSGDTTSSTLSTAAPESSSEAAAA